MRFCVTTVERPNQPPVVPTDFFSRLSRSRVKPETTSVSPSTHARDHVGLQRLRRPDDRAQAQRDDAVAGDLRRDAERHRLRSGRSPARCSATSSRGAASMVTVPCAASSAAITPVLAVRVVCRAKRPSSRSAQSTPVASRRSARPRRPAPRSAPGAARDPAPLEIRADAIEPLGKSVTCSRPAFRSTLNVARSDSSVRTPFARSANTSPLSLVVSRA